MAEPPKAPKTSEPGRARRRRTIRLATGPFRLWSAFCVVAFVISLFAGRLIQLQGIDENDYAALAAAKGAQTITLDATRGSITDRFGAKLAESVSASRLVADPTYTSAHATQIASILPHRIGVDYLATVAALRTKNTRYVELARHLAPRLATDIVTRLNHQNLPGVYTAHDTLRVYPGGDVAANLIGFVGSANDGQYGLEEALNSTLKGKDGTATYQVEGGQILPLADSDVHPAREGTGVRLTLDQDLQFLAQRRVAEAVKEFDADSGAAIVMDARTSQVLALADYPSYNANDFVTGDEPYAQSSALYDAYEPGSVEKVLTFSALIDAGYVTPTTKVVVPPVLPVGGYTVHDDFGHGTLHLTTAGVLAVSSNIGTVRSASKMPNAQLYGYLKKFGLGDPLEVGLQHTAVGTLAPPSTWPEIQRADIDFGQGVSVNALQMATAISAVAHGGVYTAPSLIEGTVAADGTYTPAAAPAHHRSDQCTGRPRGVAHDGGRREGSRRDRSGGGDPRLPGGRQDGHRATGQPGLHVLRRVEHGVLRGLRAGRQPAVRHLRRRTEPTRRELLRSHGCRARLPRPHGRRAAEVRRPSDRPPAAHPADDLVTADNLSPVRRTRSVDVGVPGAWRQW